VKGVKNIGVSTQLADAGVETLSRRVWNQHVLRRPAGSDEWSHRTSASTRDPLFNVTNQRRNNGILVQKMRASRQSAS